MQGIREVLSSSGLSLSMVDIDGCVALTEEGRRRSPEYCGDRWFFVLCEELYRLRFSDAAYDRLEKFGFGLHDASWLLAGIKLLEPDVTLDKDIMIDIVIEMVDRSRGFPEFEAVDKIVEYLEEVVQEHSISLEYPISAASLAALRREQLCPLAARARKGRKLFFRGTRAVLEVLEGRMKVAFNTSSSALTARTVLQNDKQDPLVVNPIIRGAKIGCTTKPDVATWIETASLVGIDLNEENNILIIENSRGNLVDAIRDINEQFERTTCYGLLFTHNQSDDETQLRKSLGANLAPLVTTFSHWGEDLLPMLQGPSEVSAASVEGAAPTQAVLQ